MRRVEFTCVAVGALMVTACAALIYLPAGIGVAGAMLMVAGWPKGEAR